MFGRLQCGVDISVAFGSLHALQLAHGMLPEKKSTSGLLVGYQVELRTSGLKSCFQGGVKSAVLLFSILPYWGIIF